MEKKLISVHAVTIHIYTIAIALLLLLLMLLGLKYAHLKLAVKDYTKSTIWMNQQARPTGQIGDYGLIVGQAYQSIPQADLQNFVTDLSKKINRDVLILDRNKKILADTLSANKGKVYDLDNDNQIIKTMEDGQTRTFEERSSDYPNGLLEVVVPIKNVKNEVLGAVLVSNSSLK
jgi:hypothetical protein